MAHDSKWNVQDNIWHFAVTDPQLHSKGFTVYKVTCKTFPIRSPEALTEVVCWKRYNDFKVLHKSLLALHKALHRRDQFPEFAKPKLFGRFDENVIEERRMSSLELLNFVATQPHLYKSLVFKQFLEEGKTDTDIGTEPSLMQPEPSSLESVSGELGSSLNPKCQLKSDVQHNFSSVKPTSFGAKFEQGKKEQAGLQPGNGSQRNNNAKMAVLEGTWNFPQVSDNISLSSSTGDDTNDTDDESILATSFPDTDLAYFDPINIDTTMTEVTEISEDTLRSNSWLLEGLNISSVMKSDIANNCVQDEDETTTPIFVKSSNDRTDTVLNSGSVASSSTLGKQSDVDNPVTSSRKGSFGSGKTTPSKTADLEEFDPLGPTSQSPDGAKVECGRGDLDLSLEEQGSISVSSDVSSCSHGSQSSSYMQSQDRVHTEHTKKSGRSQNAGSDKSEDSEKTSSSKSTPTSLLKRLVSGSPVAQKPQSLVDQNVASSDLNGKEDYIYLAANHISMAQNSEVNGEYEIAFAYYKSGVGILLQGVQGDTNQSRRDAVRRKTAQYLMKAEDLFNRYLADENVDERRWGVDSFFSPSLDLDPSFAFIRGSVRELRNFQVLGYIDKVVLVRDKVTDETFVIKSVPKSTPDVVRTQSILPTSCPYMVNLHKFYETDDSVFLLLQYASGGKLWTYIGDYLNSDRGLQANGDMDVNTMKANVRNIYSGGKPETANKSINELDSVAAESVDVFKQKTDSRQADRDLSFEGASRGNVQSAETIDVMRFSDLREKHELYSVDVVVKDSCHDESFDAEGMVSPDISESHDRFDDSDLNDVFKHAHKKQSRNRRFSSLSDDCAQAYEDEACAVSPSIDEDHFHFLLHENRGNLEAFSINSIDSEDTSRNSLSFHERTHSITEHCEDVSSAKHVTSRQISADEVFHLSRKETLPVNFVDKVRHASTDGVFSQNISSRLVSVVREDLLRYSEELPKHSQENLVAETLQVNPRDKVEHACTDGVFSQDISSRLVSVVNSEDLSRHSDELPKHSQENLVAETLPVNSRDEAEHACTDGVFSENISSRLVSVDNSEDLTRHSDELPKHSEEILVAEMYDKSQDNDNISTVENPQSCACLETHSCYSDDIIQETSNSVTNKSPEDITAESSVHSPSSSRKVPFSPAENDLGMDTSINNMAATANNIDVEPVTAKDSAVHEESENPFIKKDSENTSANRQSSVAASITSASFRHVSTPRKLSLNRISSKDMTRSASFECDLKSPTRNRARAVSDLFERLDSTNKEQIQIPEASIRKWMAQLVTAVSRLHSLGIICRDLKPSNILLGDGGQVYLTYFCSLGHGDPELDWEAVQNLYAAPEVSSVSGYDRTCDWWSIGALLYELIVGRSLIECHPGGINSHTCLYVPAFVSSEARGLLEGLLNHNPHERLGSGMAGSEEIKAHPFFSGVDWHTLEYS
ncbi:unnamed protein product [Candidula unifasciata]|uniref:Ribosomal protein S6 kinase delta-1 n=1 Tax=Candidula unifasciata TaxID=100452 RepID=A0A8S3Z4W9_9EUPU|nr:unnamed protein product [Candidula unifasciata]